MVVVGRGFLLRHHEPELSLVRANGAEGAVVAFAGIEPNRALQRFFRRPELFCLVVPPFAPPKDLSPIPL